MPVLEELKEYVRRATGLRRRGRDEATGLARPRKPHTVRFKDDGLIPNHPRWPFVIYRGGVDFGVGHDPAAVMEDLFEANGWGDTWRDGICHYAHYHSRIHEVLGITRGKEAAALDAAGAALGAVGMLAFAAVFWWIVERSVAGAFAAASLAWLVVSITCWFARRKLRAVHRPRRNSDPAMSGSLGPGDTS